jgi:hypothetical protein
LKEENDIDEDCFIEKYIKFWKETCKQVREAVFLYNFINAEKSSCMIVNIINMMITLDKHMKKMNKRDETTVQVVTKTLIV